MFENIDEDSSDTYLAICSLKLLEMSRIDYYDVRRIPENLAGGDDISNFSGLLL